MQLKNIAFTLITVSLFQLCLAQSLSAATVEYHLTIGEKMVNLTGRPRMTLAVNGSIPGPTLTFHEGDLARIHVTNATAMDTSIHWHGMLVPNRMDGVPFVTYPPIKPGATFDYEFPIKQHGTYWYHSHTMLQEQEGVYGALRILPRGAVSDDVHRTIVLSDWTDENPHEVLRWLKRGSEWPSLERGTAQSVLGALTAGKEGDYWKRDLLRMPPMDLSDVAYDRFLANGEVQHAIPVRPHDRVRLRLIDGSSATYFYLQFAGGPMTIVAADGQDVQPVNKDRFLIATAETYDVLVTVPGPGSYELRATAQDGSAFTSVWLGQGQRHPAPDVPHANLYDAMGELKLRTIFALTPGGTMGMSNQEVDAGKFDKPGVMDGMKMEHMSGHDSSHPGPATNSYDGKSHSWDYSLLGADVSSRAPLTMDGMGARPEAPYKDLRAIGKTAFVSSRPVREVRLTLEGDMERYVWSINNKPIYASNSIKIRKGETVRFVMINRSMMHHPMHLHGHFFRVINGQGDYSPLKHTVDVAPMETTVIEFAAEQMGDWFFHCHILYHMESGMARVVHYEGFEPYADTAAIRHDLYRDPFYFWGTADILSNMTQGYLELANTQNIFNAEWEAGWAEVKGTEVETTELYERYYNRFFRLIAGVDTNGDVDRGYKSESNRGVFGFMYKLPLNIESTIWVDTDGGARVRIAKDIPLTPRLMLGGEVRYDTNDLWQERVHLDYMLSKNFSLFGQWHSDYGWGGGLRVEF